MNILDYITMKKVLGGSSSGASAKLGELTVTSNGEYEAKVHGAVEVGEYVIDQNTPPDVTSADMGMSFWKTSDAVPTDLEEFKSISSLTIDAGSQGSMTMGFGDMTWNAVDGAFAVGASGEMGIIVINDPAAFKTIVINEIPKNDSGKTLYKELAKYYE